ncbi:hypothetical protein ECANGB1_1603 [Enterospora canceri]|uniref:Uncharacterized protein n=1 Tax=Enterospora canceri TaxID=1081671 RepID=A0A1Y1S6C7_9MICR|nr:hypothetical protein ECANGB1_1603 [Enterospora canceri]
MLLSKINSYISGEIPLSECFTETSFIRLNMIYVFPESLRFIVGGLSKFGLQKCHFTEDGLNFHFADGTNFQFEGRLRGYAIKSLDRINSLEIDFGQPPVANRTVACVLKSIERSMMKADCFFFMLYRFDFDSFVLNHELVDSIDLLTLEIRRRLSNKR